MLIVAAKSGQLGNRLLLFAHFIAWAIEDDFTVLNPAFEEYAEFFTGTANNLFCCYPAPYFNTYNNRYIRSKYYKFIKYLSDRQILTTKEITRKEPFSWSKYQETEKLDRAAIICFTGWLFRDGWFVEDLPKLRQHADPIRSYFTPVEPYKINVNNLIATLKNSADIIIGIHIRQGDYDRHQNGRYFYTIEQYIAVMKAAVKLFTKNSIKFLICSNVQQEPKLFKDFNLVFGSGHLIEDMYALSECDYIIGPPSSYTMWAAFYGEKPLYMMRDASQAINLNDFVHFYDWQGVFNYRDNWSESFWDWTH
jgi:Glycosyl transferase family 11